MTGRRIQLGTGAILVAAAALTPLGAQEDFTWTGGMDTGQVLEVKGITGSIRVARAAGATAAVVAEKRGRSSDFDEVEVRVVEQRDGITVCAVYHPRERGEASCGQEDRDDDRHRDRNRSLDVAVDYVVQLPAGVDFVGTMVTGDIEVEGVASNVSAMTVTGDVVVSTTETARANTVSGSMDIEMRELEGSQRFNTVSGDITLRLPANRLPANLDADVRFQSLSGDLDSDFDLDIAGDGKRQWIGSNIRATIGDGTHRISLKTVSGDVNLKRAR